MIYDDFQPDKFEINYINNELENKSVKDVLDDLLKWSDCTRIYNDGSRPMTTYHYGYIVNAWYYDYVLQYAKEKNINVDEYKNKFIELHNKNIEFEKLNPPVIYEKRKRNKNTINKSKETVKKVRRVRTKDIFTGEIHSEYLREDGSLKPSFKDVNINNLVFNFKTKK